MEQVFIGVGPHRLMLPNQLLPKSRGFFERPAESFNLDPRVIGWILADESNPLNQIAKAISSGSTVLDVGAGNGILPRLLEALGKQVSIDAIEPDLAACELAKFQYRQCFNCDLENFLENREQGEKGYDFIVMADVLEHIANPEPLLRSTMKLLIPGGRILLSTPNIAFASVRLALLRGRFDYTDSGLLERTHLRFYTRKSLITLFEICSLNVAAEFHCLRDPFSMEISIDDLSLFPILLVTLENDPLCKVYQFVFQLTFSNVDYTPKIQSSSESKKLTTYFTKRKIKDLKIKIYNLFKSS